MLKWHGCRIRQFVLRGEPGEVMEQAHDRKYIYHGMEKLFDN